MIYMYIERSRLAFKYMWRKAPSIVGVPLAIGEQEDQLYLRRSIDSILAAVSFCLRWAYDSVLSRVICRPQRRRR